jgi:hypothetical protein
MWGRNCLLFRRIWVWSRFLLVLVRFVLFMLLNYVFTFFVLYCDIRYDFRVMFDSSWLLFVGVCVLFTLFVFIYVYWCRTRFLYQMMFGSFNGNTTSVTCGAETAYPSKTSPDFSVVRISRSLVFCVKFCRSLSVLFLLTIVFDVIPRLTAFDYSFAIFKLFWHTWYIYLNFS